MPQFTYSATDATGQVIEGTVAANDMMVAADQVRRMGYTPVRVEMENRGQGTVPGGPAAQSTAVMPGAEAQSLEQRALHAQTPNTEHRTPNTPAPLDLSQMYATPENTANTLNTLLAPPLNGGAELTTAPGRKLEPWERSVAANEVVGQELATAQATGETVPTVGTVNGLNGTLTTGNVTNANGMYVTPQQTAGRVQGREGVRIPYGVGLEPEKNVWQRFLEQFVYPLRSGVVLKELAPYLRQFATLINAGLPLYQSLVALESNTPNAKLKEITREAQKQVQAGGKFSDVMAAYPWIFQPMQIAMVRAAEQGGMLDQVLRQIADYVEHDIEIRRLISRETLYPKITLFCALMILGRQGFTGGLPAVSGLVLGGMGHGTYTFLNYLGDTVGFGFMVAIPIVAAMIACRLFLFNVPSIREGYETFKMAIPGLGKVSQMFSTARFARTYAALYKGGFPVGSTLAIAGDACGNALLRRAALNAIPHAERGGLVSDALARTHAFPSMALDMLRTGETTGATDQMLDRLADFYEAEGKQKSHMYSMILGTVVFLLVALLVGKAILEQYMSLGASRTTLPDDGHGE